MDIGAYEYQPPLRLTGARFLSSSTFWLQVSGTPNQAYTLQISTDLVTWDALRNITTDANGRCELIDSNVAGAGTRFYRVQAR